MILQWGCDTKLITISVRNRAKSRIIHLTSTIAPLQNIAQIIDITPIDIANLALFNANVAKGASRLQHQPSTRTDWSNLEDWTNLAPHPTSYRAPIAKTQ